MKRFLPLILLFLISLTVSAQKEQDFASRYMALYADGTSLSCTTVSPTMMERVLSLPDVADNKDIKQLLQQIKSIRMVTNTDKQETDTLYGSAVGLAKRNTSRYKLKAEEGDKQLYVRKRGKAIVEMVLLMKQQQRLYMVSVTGNLDDAIVEQILKL